MKTSCWRFLGRSRETTMMKLQKFGGRNFWKIFRKSVLEKSQPGSWLGITINKELENFLKYINDGLRNGISNPEVAAKFVYWQGKLAVLGKKQKRAQRIFNNLLSWYPNTFYGMLAQRTMSSLVPKKIPYKQKDYWHDNPPELKANEEKQSWNLRSL